MFAERSQAIKLPMHGKCLTSHIENVTPDPLTIAQRWISKLESAFLSDDITRLDTLMHPDCWWRDHLTFEWDFHTVQGLSDVTEFLGDKLERVRPSNFTLQLSGTFAPKLAKPMDGLEWIESMFTFETKVGRGSGYFRLVEGSDGVWKSYMVYTVLKELKGFEENVGHRRSHGGNNSLLGGSIKGNWQERRDRQKDFLDAEPTVLIIGAGEFAILHSPSITHSLPQAKPV